MILNTKAANECPILYKSIQYALHEIYWENVQIVQSWNMDRRVSTFEEAQVIYYNNDIIILNCNNHNSNENKFNQNVITQNTLNMSIKKNNIS